MTPMHAPKRSLLLALPACVLVAVAWRSAPATDATPEPGAAPRQQAVEFEPFPVTESIFMLDSGIGGNIGVCLGEDGVFLIDDQFDRTAPALKEALGRLTDDGVEFLLNTHYHGDHTGGNPILGPGATILAHDNVRRRLMGPALDGSAPSEAMLAEGLPELTYADAVTLHVNGQTIRAEHFPASHTDGDTVVFFEEANVVHMGDLYFSGRFPFIDLDGGGSVDGLIASVEAILSRIDGETTLIPGHGPLSKQADLEAYLAMLKDCRSKVSAALEGGQPAEDMKTGNLLADYADWSWGFISAERFIDTLVAAAGR